MNPIITKHGKERLKERVGLRGEAARKDVQRALEQGLTMEETDGALYKYLVHLFCTHGSIGYMRIHNYKIYAFAKDAFITVYPLPRQYANAFERARKKKAATMKTGTTEEKEKESMSELQLIKSENFGAIQCDFYQVENDYYMTREQIGKGLDYAYPQEAIQKIHERHKGRLDKFSAQVNLTSTDGKSYATTVYNRKGVMEICRWSQQPKADEFMDFVWNTMDDLYAGNSQKAMSPAEIVLLQAQALVAIERKQSEQQAALEGVTHRLDTIGNIISLNPNDWRRECRDMLSKIAYSLGDIGHVRKLQQEVYQLMDDRFGVRLSVRLTNMKRVAAENGMCKSKRDKLNYLDVIGADKKLIEAYVIIVKEMAIKHGLDKTA